MPFLSNVDIEPSSRRFQEDSSKLEKRYQDSPTTLRHPPSPNENQNGVAGRDVLVQRNA